MLIKWKTSPKPEQNSRKTIYKESSLMCPCTLLTPLQTYLQIFDYLFEAIVSTEPSFTRIILENAMSIPMC